MLVWALLRGADGNQNSTAASERKGTSVVHKSGSGWLRVWRQLHSGARRWKHLARKKKVPLETLTPPRWQKKHQWWTVWTVLHALTPRLWLEVCHHLPTDPGLHQGEKPAALLVYRPLTSTSTEHSHADRGRSAFLAGKWRHSATLWASIKTLPRTQGGLFFFSHEWMTCYNPTSSSVTTI